MLGAASPAAAGAAVAASGTDASAQQPSGRMTVHILDLYSGTPPSGVAVELFTKAGNDMKLVKALTTGANGRPDSGPHVAGDAFTPGATSSPSICRPTSRRSTRRCPRISSAGS
jgi:hypothetical protein